MSLSVEPTPHRVLGGLKRLESRRGVAGTHSLSVGGAGLAVGNVDLNASIGEVFDTQNAADMCESDTK